MITIQQEKMRRGFEKFHIRGLPFNAVIHTFSVTDNGVIHDHPFAFTTHILKGSYIERIYQGVDASGTVLFEEIKRETGSSHRVEASCIHELIALPDGDCWTIITPENWEREPGFWKFDQQGGWFRQHNKRKFRLLMTRPL
ncbi:MAG: hypothetical protein EOP52_11100 [Sphingobacteriales bacterium]|nr:MAG: hypothetical protein EOP52_11100 [Sphingobacteriales bacterium]